MALGEKRLHTALDGYRKNLQEAARRFQRLPVLVQEQLTARILYALDRFKEGRRGAADTVANAVMAILFETLPAEQPPLLHLAFASLTGAIMAEGARSLAHGEDYDWVSSQMAFDLTTGFSEAPARHLGPEQLLDLLALGELTAARAYRLTTKMLLSEKESVYFEPASLEQYLSELLQDSALSGNWQVDAQTAAGQVVRGSGCQQALLILKTAIALAAETEGHARIRDCALRYAFAGAVGARHASMLPAVARISGPVQLSIGQA